ncbi:hypothetical protein [Luteimonas terrae]|uniref:Nuclear transport factor 2 family protein n=1 Tax=Luteimonas terrae TaxID=1530191 RepID=A0A4R5U9K0_9GAMM|nr:hypothetical protein [Luteimonas terrae]TDK30942.1 hypothetical protein E2F49_11435 [Luteimonas terrae]
MRAFAHLRPYTIWCLLTLVMLLPGCASTGKQASALERAQYAWSGAVRWNDFQTAWQLVDPDYRAAHPASDLDFARYEQVQVTSYRETGGQAGPEDATRQVQIGVVNRHTMAERTVRYTERWRWDAAAGTWWIVDGLPDFWAGQ